MVIVYESKTGFTKKYADMLATKTKLKVFSVKEISKVNKSEGIIFLGWMKAGKIQGLNKVRAYTIKAVCASGTAIAAEPSNEAVIGRNKIEGIPFFYLRGGCFPVKELKGMNKIMMILFLKMLKTHKEEHEEAILHIENGFDGVKEENLLPVVKWFNSQVLA